MSLIYTFKKSKNYINHITEIFNYLEKEIYLPLINQEIIENEFSAPLTVGVNGVSINWLGSGLLI